MLKVQFQSPWLFASDLEPAQMETVFLGFVVLLLLPSIKILFAFTINYTN